VICNLENKLESVSVHLAYTVTMFVYHKPGLQGIEKNKQRLLSCSWTSRKGTLGVMVLQY